MKSRVAQSAGDDFDAAVVAIEADFGQQHTLGACSFLHGWAHQVADGRNRPNTSASASMHSWIVARCSAASSNAGITFWRSAAALRNLSSERDTSSEQRE